MVYAYGLYAAAMANVVLEFSDAHIQDKHWRQKIGLVDMFGAWLERRGYGKFFKWNDDSSDTSAPVLVALEQDGAPKVPGWAALLEYVLVQVWLLILWCGW